MKYRGYALALGLALFASAPGSSAQADLVSVPNFSFEDPVASEVAGYSSNGYVHYFTDDSSSMTSSNFTPPQQTALGWTPFRGGEENSGTHIGLIDVATFNAPGGAELPNPPVGNPSDGNQVAYITANGPDGTYGSLTSPSLGTIKANTVYTLIVALGSHVDLPANRYDLMLLANGDSIAAMQVLGVDIPPGEWADFVLEFDSALDPSFVGQTLAIELRHTRVADEFAAGGYGLFDNVRLETVTIPEPTALALLGMGCLGLLAVRRRGLTVR